MSYKDASLIIKKITTNNLSELYNPDTFWILGSSNACTHIKTIMSDFQSETYTVYLIAPNNILDITCTEDTNIYCIGFSLEFLHTEFNDLMTEVFDLYFVKISDPSFPLSKRNFKICQRIVYLMLSELQRKDYSDFILKNLLKNILAILIRENYIQKASNMSNVNANRLYAFFELAFKSFKQQKGTNFYAQNLNISTKRLNQILNEFLQKSIKSILNELLEMEAKKLLKEDKMSINQIAEELGFEDRAYFSRFFKKMTGHSPYEYTKRFLSNN